MAATTPSAVPPLAGEGQRGKKGKERWVLEGGQLFYGSKGKIHLSDKTERFLHGVRGKSTDN